ncbi:MAG: rhodanese-like domain-containing protein [Litorimonas sp.]
MCAFIGLSGCARGEDGLAALHADIASDYPAVAHVAADRMNALEDVLLLDIREPDEFAVSRLPGAVRVSPDVGESELLSAVGDLSGRTVVVYCSVGRRSSIFARDWQDRLVDAGAVSVRNLEGGIFRWHGQRRALEDDRGETDAVHPYDEIWKRYVMRPEAAAYAPKP